MRFRGFELIIESGHVTTTMKFDGENPLNYTEKREKPIAYKRMITCRNLLLFSSTTMPESVYGSWYSPLSSKLACDSSVSIKRLYVDAHNPGVVYWSELHPKENGRTIVFSKQVHRITEEATRWTPDEFNVMNTVHEYGGASFCVSNGTVYFMNYGFEDNKIYSQKSAGKDPAPVTHQNKNFRYADPDFSANPNFFFCIREDHSDPTAEECRNVIVCVNVSTGEETLVEHGNNFYSFPQVSPDGKKIVWMEWKHPDMPWDDTEIWVADISFDGEKVKVSNKQQIAVEKEVNFMQPQWTSDNKLMYICDKTGWWNLYLDDFVSGPKNVYKKDQEIGSPCWNFGDRSYSPHPTDKDVVAIVYDHKPYILTISTGKAVSIEVGNASISSCVFQPSNGHYLYMHAVYPVEPGCILQYHLHDQKMEVLHKSAERPVDVGYLSEPEKVVFPVDKNGANAYGYYYAPKNADYTAPANTKPPLLIKIHGGPTAAASTAMDLQKQYFTSRGFAVLDVDYRGSTGYGTPFRKALRLNWGVHDINDTIAAALYMVEVGKADRDKLCISGGSSGGYTTLADLTFDTIKPKTFVAGASYYGISKMAALAADTHKFESHYCDRMIAEYPEEISTYDERSPYYSRDKFKTPCAFFQGKLDKVVPPDQSKDMYDALEKAGIPCAYVLFEDEAHGFDKSENKQKSLDGEFYFYSQIIGFKAADEGIEIDIANLPEK